MPTALEALRDCACDRHAVHAWAVQYHLASPAVVDHALGLRQFWRQHPAARPGEPNFHVTWRVTLRTAVVTRPEVVAWEQLHSTARPFFRPTPYPTETKAEYLERMGAVYDERVRLFGAPPRPYQWAARFERACRWLVRRRVLSESLSTIAKRDGVDRAAVSRETNKLAQLLSLLILG